MHAATKKVIFAFRGDSMCFIHVLLNGIDLRERGLGGEIVMEGEAITLLPEIRQQGHPLYSLYQKAREMGIFAGACKACSAKLKMTEVVEQEGLEKLGDMTGHPAMAGYIENGYDIITF